MASIGWTDLPAVVREAIQSRTGKVTDSRPADGDRSDITATLETEKGPVFIKGANGGRFARSLSNEAATNPHVSSIAPRLLWQIEAGGWIVLGFEHVNGRHADYSPGSPDLPLLKAAVDRLQVVPLPEHVRVGVERYYGGLEAMAGTALLHIDLHPDNVLIADGQAYLVDWAWACKGAEWAELAMLVFRLMAAGHTIDSAEAWGRAFPSWQDGHSLNAFVRANAQSWDRAAQRDPQDWKVRASQLARQWVDQRMQDA